MLVACAATIIYRQLVNRDMIAIALRGNAILVWLRMITSARHDEIDVVLKQPFARLRLLTPADEHLAIVHGEKLCGSLRLLWRPRALLWALGHGPVTRAPVPLLRHRSLTAAQTG